MKCLYFTDIHTNPFNEFSRPTKDGRTSLIEEHDATYEWIASQVEEERPSLVVNLGDTSHTIGYLDAVSLTSIERGNRLIRNACSSVGAEFRTMIGNHDILNDASRVHVLPFIENTVTEVTLDEDRGILYIPFFRHEEDWKPLVSQALETGKVKRVLIHLDVVGARFNASPKLCKSGMNPCITESGPGVIGGHFHHPQVLSNNFYLIGSCMYRNFNDDVVSGMPRGIVIDEVNGVPTLHQSVVEGKLRRIENPHTSIYTTIRQESDDLDDFVSKFTSIPNPDRTYVRVIFPAKLTEVYDLYKDEFRGSRPVPVKEKKGNVVPIPGLPSAFDPHKVVDTYLAQNPPSDSSLLDYHKSYIHSAVDAVLGTLLGKTQHSIRILGARIENFLSIQAQDIRFDSEGVIYLDGVLEGREADVSNGAGKSSIFEAIYWALFGELVRKFDGGIDKIVNNKTRRNCLVSLFCIVDDQEYQIDRTRKHIQYGEDLRIYHNGSLVSEGVENSKRFMKNTFGIDSDIFKHTTLLVDSLATRFSTLAPRARMELLEAAVQLSMYDKLYDHLHTKLATFSRELEASLISIQRNEGVIQELGRNREGMSKSLSELTLTLSREIEAKREAMAKHQKELEDAVSGVKSKESLLIKVRENLTTVRAEAKSKTDEEKQASDNVRQANINVRLLEKELQDHRTLASGTCPTCRRPFENPVVDTTEVETRLAEARKILDAWQAHENLVRSQASALRTSCTDLQGQDALLVSKIDALKAQEHRARAAVISCQSDIASTTSQTEVHKNNLVALENRIGVLQQETEDLKTKAEAKRVDKDIASYWDSGFSPKGGCRVWLSHDALSQLSEHSVDYASFLSDGYEVPRLVVASNNSISLDVDTQAENYGLSSSGERRKIDLAIQLALSKLAAKYAGFSCNLLLLDEIDDKLDASSRRRLVNLLQRIAVNDRKTIIIASHYKEIGSYVDRVWTMRKTDGVSILVVI